MTMQGTNAARTGRRRARPRTHAHARVSRVRTRVPPLHGCCYGVREETDQGRNGNEDYETRGASCIARMLRVRPEG